MSFWDICRNNRDVISSKNNWDALFTLCRSVVWLISKNKIENILSFISSCNFVIFQETYKGKFLATFKNQGN